MVALFSVILFNMNILATSNTVSSGVVSPVEITRLNVTASVDKCGVVTVSENFDVKFKEPGLHEVVRYVPYACYQYREIGGEVERDTKYAKITNITGSGENGEKLNTYVDEINGYITIGLKDGAGFDIETRTFTIGYTYNTGNDTNKWFDDVYFNLVGTNSTCEIQNVSFTVVLPEAVADGSVQMYRGVAESTDVQNFSVSGNVIEGTTSRLSAGEGITLRVVYPEGHLDKQSVQINARQIIASVLCVVCVALAVVCFVCYRQKNNYPKPVELVPFDGLDPFVADYMANEEISTKTISASIICLANLGYLTIKEQDKKNISFCKTQKDIEGLKNVSLKAVYNALFKGEQEEVKMSNLRLDFAESVTAVQSAEKIKQNSTLYDSKKKSGYSTLKLVSLIMIFITALVVFNIPKNYFGFSTNLFNFVNIFFGTFLVYNAILCFFERKNLWIYNAVSSTLLLACMITAYMRFKIYQIDKGCVGLIVLFALSVLPVFLNIVSKYSKNGAILKGRVLGFKNYIKMCEVEQLKMFAKENPNYYFDVLPYAYIFGLSDVWIEKFKAIEVKIPDWITTDTNEIWDYMMFNSMFMRFNSNLSRSINLRQVNIIGSTISSFGGRSGGSGHSSGGFGGGGFSGGGSGGGGFGAR